MRRIPKIIPVPNPPHTQVSKHHRLWNEHLLLGSDARNEPPGQLGGKGYNLFSLSLGNW